MTEPSVPAASVPAASGPAASVPAARVPAASGPDSSGFSSGRRTLLAGVGAGAACAVTLAGCSTYNANSGIAAPPPAASRSAPASAGSGGGSASAAAPAPLTTTSQVPVGGGQILAAKKIVVTQPQAGTFKAFSAVCTHLGCIVGTVSGGTINCPCHGSKYSIANGSVVNGPAVNPLPPVSIEVQGTNILQG